jgi:hypothetical protein
MQTCWRNNATSKIRDESDNGSENSFIILVSSYKATQCHNPHNKTQYFKIDNNSTEISKELFSAIFQNVSITRYSIPSITYCCEE